MITVNFEYNPQKMHLILTTPKGKPVISVTGQIAKVMYDRINQKNKKPADMTKKQLETKVNDLNEWLMNPVNCKGKVYSEREHNRNYYVSKLIELEESKQKTIRV